MNEGLLPHGEDATGGGIEMEELQHLNESSKERVHFRADNFDLIFTRLYEYYYGKGFTVLMLTGLYNVIVGLLIILISTFLFSCIDYEILFRENSLSQAIDFSGIQRMNAFLAICELVFVFFWIWHICHFFHTWFVFREIRTFYNHMLDLSDREIQTMEWDEVVARIAAVQQDYPNLLPGQPPVNALEITNRIMRRKNYLIGLFSKMAYTANLPVPFAAVLQHYLFTSLMEWVLTTFVISHVFNTDNTVRNEVVTMSQRDRIARELRWRMRITGFLMLILSPFIFIFLILYYIFRYGEEFYSDVAAIGTRTWSLLAKWQMREFNELPHQFNKRIGLSHPPANRYIAQFPTYAVGILAQVVAFIASAFVMVLLLFSFIDEELLTEMEIFGHSALWLMGIMVLIAAMARKMVPKESDVFDPQAAMDELCRYTHYLPETWRGNVHHAQTLDKFLEMYRFRITLLLQEIFSVFLTPFALLFLTPKYSHTVVDFFRENTKIHGQVGPVCVLALFDLDQQPSSSPHSPAPSPALDAYSFAEEDLLQSKVEKSLITFVDNHPSYEPTAPMNTFFRRLNETVTSPAQSFVDLGAELPSRSRLLYNSRMPAAKARNVNGQPFSAEEFYQKLEFYRETHLLPSEKR